MSVIPNGHIAGDWFDNCSCAIACPCTFGQAPDNDLCEFVLFWHIVEGHCGDVTLDGLLVVRVGSFDGSLWDRNARGHFRTFSSHIFFWISSVDYGRTRTNVNVNPFKSVDFWTLWDLSG